MQPSRNLHGIPLSLQAIQHLINGREIDSAVQDALENLARHFFHCSLSDHSSTSDLVPNIPTMQPFANPNQLHLALVSLGFHPPSLQSDPAVSFSHYSFIHGIDVSLLLHCPRPSTKPEPKYICQQGEQMTIVFPGGYHLVIQPNPWASLTRLGDVRFPRPAGIVRG